MNIWVDYWDQYDTQDWKEYRHFRYVDSGFTHEFKEGTYRLQLQAYNSNEWEDGYSDWVHTVSDWYYLVVSDPRPSEPSFTNFKSYAVEDEPIRFTWNSTLNTTHYNIWVDYKDDSGNWKRYNHFRYVESGFTHEFAEGEYRLELQSYNSEEWESDHSDWVHTISDWYYLYVEPAHTHSYASSVTSPTCTSGGYTTYTCSCGDSYTGSYTDALGHNYANGVCTRCGAKDPNYVPPKVSFTDVSTADYCYDAVQWAVANGITNGTGNNTFSPDKSCSRAEVVTFLWRAAGEPSASATVNFTDVKPTDYFYKAVQWAVENKITTGAGNNTFLPNNICTRSQVVTFLWRANGSPIVSGGGFADVASSAYYCDAVRWAVSEKITTGTGNGQFSPDALCTRGQVVTFLFRAK